MEKLKSMVPSSYLRVYQPLASFEPKERARWASYIEGGAQLPLWSPYKHVAFDEPNQMGLLYPSNTEHAFVKQVREDWFVCPWRTKLRVLVGLLNFRNSLPFEIADAFVPEEAAVKAASQLEQLRASGSELLANINTSTWQVPLRWFIPFDDEERLVTEERGRIRVRYETTVAPALTRLERALSIMSESGMAETVTEPVSDLLDWLKEFPAQSILELDYGSVCNLFSEEELVLDHSAAEIWSCMESLANGDFEESGRVYSELAGWWSRVRALESAN